MRVRGRGCRITVALQEGPRPVLICAGPGCTIESDIAEARQLALDLADAIEQVQRGGGRGC